VDDDEVEGDAYHLYKDVDGSVNGDAVGNKKDEHQ